MSNTDTDGTNPQNPNESLPHPPGAGHAPRTPAIRPCQRRRRGPTRTCSSTQLSSPTSGTRDGPGQEDGQTRRTHGLADDHGNVIKKSSRTLSSRARVKGYVRHWNPRAPPPRKLNALDAGSVSAHITCETGARDTFPAAQNVNSVKGREGGLDADQHYFPPDPWQERARGQELTTRDTQACRLMPANTGVLRRTQPAAPDGTPRHQGKSQATLTSGHDTKAPTCQPQNPQDTARYGKQQAGKYEHEHRTTQQAQHPGARWGPRGCTEGDRRGLATEGVVNMICTSAAERTAEGHCKIPDDELCV